MIYLYGLAIISAAECVPIYMSGYFNGFFAWLTPVPPQDEIREVLLQAAIYCGMPAGLEGFRVAQRALEAVKEEKGSKTD